MADLEADIFDTGVRKEMTQLMPVMDFRGANTVETMSEAEMEIRPARADCTNRRRN